MPIAVGDGPITSPRYEQHLALDGAGRIHVAIGSIIHHWGDALPFDVHGRLVLSYNDVAWWDQGIPFTAGGFVAVQEEAVDWIDQGVGFTNTGHMSVGVEGTVIPGEYFQYYTTDPGTTGSTVAGVGLFPMVSQVAVQLVFIMKQNWGDIGPDLQQIFGFGDPPPTFGFRTITDKGVGGFRTAFNDPDNTPAGQIDHPGNPQIGDVVDIRYQIDLTDTRGWIDKANLDTDPFTEFSRTLNSWDFDDTYARLLAIRFVQPDPTDTEILAWPEYTAPLPVWGTIPNQFNYQYQLPDTLDVTPYVSGPIGAWALVAPVPAGFTIDQDGIITCAGAAAADHTIVVRAVSTDYTTADATFQWEVELGNVPSWTPIPDQTDRVNELPKTLDIKPYVASDSGPILDYLLDSPPAGFSISGGVITAAAGTAVAAHGVTVRATNGVGASDDTFTWNVLQELIPPVWSTVPGQVDIQSDLPKTLDVSPYVTSNAGALTNWVLITPPTGFTIDQSGVVTAGASAALATHTIVVQVENDVDNSSTSFLWAVNEELLAPIWNPVPAKTTAENLLPTTYDVAPYVTSNSGALTGWSLTTPPTGFTIDGNGVITAAAGTAVSVHALTVEVTNDTGTTPSAPFNWEITLFYLVPQWSVIPNQSDGDDTLPVAVDISGYVSSNSGALTNWSIVTPITGFSISASGVITVAAGTAPASHSVTVRVENNEGPADSAAFTWDILSVLEAPVWSTIPAQSDGDDTLPQTLDVTPYVTTNNGALTAWTLVTPPAGFTIDGAGTITVAPGTAVDTHAITVRVSNDSGPSDSAAFNWQILSVISAPVWAAIPAQSNTSSELPATLDVTPYVATNSGALTGWALVAPPTGFSIDGAGTITVAGGTASAVYPITVSVSNDEGPSDSAPFNWTLSDALVVPQWSTIPNQTHGEDVLPQTLDVSAYVTTNDGPLTGWSLVAQPAGFSIDGAGVITVAAGTAPNAGYSITVRVSNNSGPNDSAAFTWTVNSVFLPPQWSTIPPRDDDEDTLPQTYDISSYVTSNHGALGVWLLDTPPAGFSLDQAGVITVQDLQPPDVYALTVTVQNSSGTEPSDPFNWTINSVYVVPQWTTVPDQSDDEDTLPQALDLKPYVSSNHGPLTDWALVSPVTGFSIDSNGVLTVAVDTAPNAGYSIQIQVTNTSGTALSNIFSWEIGSVYLVPQWSTIPAQATEEQLLPVVLDAKPYVTTNHGALTNWSLVAPPGGWTIDSNGIITVAAGRPVASNSITVRVDNSSGPANSAAFDWDILEEPLVPQWSTIPGRQTRENLLPQNYDVSSYVTSNSGSLTGWALVAPPTGFSISGAGVITAAAGTTLASHSLTVRVSNNEGPADSASFIWEIQEELLPPQWSTVPAKQDRINILPQNYDMNPYVTSNSGALTLWALDSAPAGFSINASSGVITATAAAGVAVHQLQVSVSNSTGSNSSNLFNWEIQEELLTPQWSTIPNQTHVADQLPQTLDTSAYVTTNSGPLTTWSLVGSPTGFAIDQSGVVTAQAGAPQQVNVLTVRVFNDEGGDDSEPFNWTIESPATGQYYHEFNADLDASFWTFSRPSTQTSLDAGNVARRTVANNIPAYPGCGWSGSIFTPNTGFRGILIEPAATNQFWWSTKFDPAADVDFKWTSDWVGKCPTTGSPKESVMHTWTGNVEATLSMDVDPTENP